MMPHYISTRPKTLTSTTQWAIMKYASRTKSAAVNDIDDISTLPISGSQISISYRYRPNSNHYNGTDSNVSSWHDMLQTTKKYTRQKLVSLS